MQPPSQTQSCTAIVLAGRRPGVDPLGAHFGQPTKALIELAGKSMIARVLDTLSGNAAIGRIIVLSQEPEILSAHMGAEWTAAHPAVSFDTSGDSVSVGLSTAIAAHQDGYPFLVTTADNALLDDEMIDQFIAGARESMADVAVALVERRTLLAAYPGNKRTWLTFRGGAYSGANLFWFATPKASKLLALWQRIEQERKRARAVVGAFGPLLLAAVTLRLITLKQATAWVSWRMGLRATAVELPIAEACIDIDKVEDHALAETIIVHRGTIA